MAQRRFIRVVHDYQRRGPRLKRFLDAIEDPAQRAGYEVVVEQITNLPVMEEEPDLEVAPTLLVGRRQLFEAFDPTLQTVRAFGSPIICVQWRADIPTPKDWFIADAILPELGEPSVESFVDDDEQLGDFAQRVIVELLGPIRSLGTVLLDHDLIIDVAYRLVLAGRAEPGLLRDFEPALLGRALAQLDTRSSTPADRVRWAAENLPAFDAYPPDELWRNWILHVRPDLVRKALSSLEATAP